jgi:LPLT family lysophospholipid transporter-like MFS transporter
MTRGFGSLMGAQFASALADNAILVIAIAQLDRLHAPAWLTPMLKFVFIGSFVVFAIGVGSFADRMPKARVMLITNAVKATGCLLLLAGVHPLAAYAVIGFGAAAYSPAKYGLLAELLPAERLVAGNAWLEGLTIGSVIFGTVLGGMLVSPEFARLIGIESAQVASALDAATITTFNLYLLAAGINFFIPDSGRRYRAAATRAVDLARAFARAFVTLATDYSGRVSLLVTSLLWGIGATLQFVVIDWAREALQLPLDRAAMLPGVVAAGVVIGAALAARRVRLAQAFSVLPLGVLLGPLVASLLLAKAMPVVYLLLLLNGIAGGYFIVPMNATLQHRGYILTNAGQAIAVQNFCENLSVMLMLALYAGLRAAGIPITVLVVGLGLFLSLAMLAIQAHRLRARPPVVTTPP